MSNTVRGTEFVFFGCWAEAEIGSVCFKNNIEHFGPPGFPFSSCKFNSTIIGLHDSSVPALQGSITVCSADGNLNRRASPFTAGSFKIPPSMLIALFSLLITKGLR